MAEVTDITRSGDSLVMGYEMDTEGQMFVSAVLERDGEGLTVEFDFGGQLYATGIGTRADG